MALAVAVSVSAFALVGHPLSEPATGIQVPATISRSPSDHATHSSAPSPSDDATDSHTPSPPTTPASTSPSGGGGGSEPGDDSGGGHGSDD